MKRAFLIALMMLLRAVAQAQLTNVISTSYLSGTKYEFVLSFEELDRSPPWLATEECPPLSPNKAIESARAFLRKAIRPSIEWRVSTITLHKYVESGDPKGDKWAYKVKFMDAGIHNGAVPSIEVVVYMTGKVIEPHVSRGNS